MQNAGGASRSRAIAGWLLVGLALAYAALLHHGLGPPPAEALIPWWAPRGFLLDALADTALARAVEDPAAGVWVFSFPSLLLAGAVFWTSSSAVARALAASAFVASLLFSFYGIGSTPRLIWDFFQWRGSLTMVGIGLAVGGSAVAPWLARSWLRRGWPLRVVLYLPLFVAGVALVRNTTGTDPSLRFSVSPWPAISVFGLEVGAAGWATQFAGIALGVGGLALGRRSPGARGLAIALLGILLGVAFPTVSLWAGHTLGLLPFTVDAGRVLAVGLVCAAGIGLVATVANGLRAEVLLRRAQVLGIGAVFVGVPLVLGQVWARLDYTTTRQERAQPLIDALASYYAREQVYPESLEQLVAAGDLEGVPEPRIGFPIPRRTPFTYQSFGVGYVLEFSAPRWVQCTYSPPWQEEEDENDDTFAREGETAEEPDVAAAGNEPSPSEEAEESEGWTCPSKPPELW